MLPLRHCLSDELLNTTPIKSIKSKKFEINFKKKIRTYWTYSELASQVIIQCFFASLCFVLTFALTFLSVFVSHMQRWYETLQTLNWSIVSLWYWSPPVHYFSCRGVPWSYNLFFAGHFRLFLAGCRSFQVVSCLL